MNGLSMHLARRLPAAVTLAGLLTGWLGTADVRIAALLAEKPWESKALTPVKLKTVEGLAPLRDLTYWDVGMSVAPGADFTLEVAYIKVFPVAL